MLIIVESPTKTKKIQSILKVKTMSTVGHFKDLPDSHMGVDLKSYEPTFVYHEKKKKLPRELRSAAQGETVMLAGDPDREGYGHPREDPPDRQCALPRGKGAAPESARNGLTTLKTTKPPCRKETS